VPDALALDFSPLFAPPGRPGGGNPGPGEWDWLVNKLVGPVRERIWQSVVDFVSHELDILITPLREIRDRLAWLLAAMQALPVTIRDDLRSLRDGMINTVAFWLATLRAAADSLRDRVTGEIAALRDRLLATLAAWLAAIRAALDAVRDRVAGELAAARTVVQGTLVFWLSHLSGVLDAVRDRVAGELAAARALVQGVLVAWFARIEAAIASIPDRLQELWRSLLLMALQYLQRQWSDLVAGANAVAVGVLNLGGQVLVGAAGVLAKGPPPELQAVITRLTATLQTGLAAIEDQVLGEGHIKPEMAHEVASRAFLTASVTGFSAHLLSTAIELAHPLRYVGLHYLSGFLAEMGAFSGIANAIHGTLAREAIGYPMAYAIRARTRPTIPTAGDLQAMRRKHNLWASEFAEYMAYQGYSQFWIDRFEEYLPADPRLLELSRIFESSVPTGAPDAAACAYLERLGIETRAAPDWWIEMKLALAGYNWIDIPQLKQALMHKVSNTARLRLDAAASVLFRQGYMEEAAYRATLDRSEATPDRLEMKVRAEKLSALADDIGDLVALYTDQFKKDVITEPELLLALVNCGVTQHKAQILTARAVVAKMPKPAAPSRKEEEAELKKLQTSYSELYRRQYAADLITADGYYSSLLAVGVSAALARVTVELERTKRGITERDVAVRAEATAAAATRATYEKLYQERYRAGELDADGYYKRLVDIGLTPDQANGQVALERVRAAQLVARAALKAGEKEALAEQRASAELYLRRYRDGTIDRQGLLDRLLAIGIAPILAETTVALEEQQRQAQAVTVLAQVIVPALRVPFDLAVARLKAQLAAGEITDEDFIRELVGSGVAEETAALILQVLRPSPAAAPKTRR